MSKQNERAEFAAGLRELADLLERDETLPIPYSADLQAGLVDSPIPYAERCVQLRRIADRLGVNVIEHGNRSRTATLAAGPVRYKVYLSADDTPAPSGPRVVPADEDAALMGGAR